MNLEGLTLHILTNKLKEELLGGKIYKVFMPSYAVSYTHLTLPTIA